ncbi:MAG: hypothetical protein ACYC9K_01010 [Sulfuricaulis sp.]
MKWQPPALFRVLTIHGDVPTLIVLGQCTAREVPVDLERWLISKGYQFSARRGYLACLYKPDNANRFNALMAEYYADWCAQHGVTLQ